MTTPTSHKSSTPKNDPHTTSSPSPKSTGKKKGKARRWVRYMRVFFHNTLFFVTKDVWHITDVENSRPLRRIRINAIKSIYMAVRGFTSLNLSARASALAYTTVLSIVPLLAVIVGVAKGFGFQQTVYDSLTTYMPSQADQMSRIFQFVDNYLSQVQGGLFLGVGMIFLLYTVFLLLSNIESTFNYIWETPRNRPLKRKVVDYLAVLLIMPVLITLSSGLTLMMTTIKNSFIADYEIFTPVWEMLFMILPYVFIIFLFTGMFIWMPVVKVKFVPALISGTIAGVSFQVFQALYMSGLFWISKYNAIYGGFAAFPLLLLWIQLAWIIVLFSVRLCFSIQNVHMFAYEKESHQISRRYKDFLSIVIMAHIVQRFTNEPHERPHTVHSLCDECRLPISVTSKILQRIKQLDLIVEVHIEEEDQEEFYYPAVDPDILSVGYLISKLDGYGAENFRVDMKRYQAPWKLTLNTRCGLYTGDADQLLRHIAL